MDFFVAHRRFGGALLTGSLLFGTAGLQAQTQSKSVSDAQVQANVLRQLATAPELSTQNIQSSTVYGTVTLSGTVQTEALRTKAENLAARADGVKKVVDELSLGTPSTSAQNNPGAPGAPADQQAYAQSQNQQGAPQSSNGNYDPAGAGADPAEANNAPPQQQSTNPNAPQQAYNNQQQPAYGNPNQPPPNQQAYNQPYNQQQPYGQQPYAQPGQPAYPPQPGYGQQPPPSGRRPMYSNGYAPIPDGGAPGAGQQAGLPVVVPSGALIQVRINRGIDSNHIAPGTPFDGIVMNDVVAGGAVAIPRGASVQGTVIDAKKAGTFKGQGELGLQLTGLTLGGQTYQIASNPWGQEGRDKTATTVNSTVGIGALGAILGGIAGGGGGAAIGAAAGAGVGLAGAASSPKGRVIVPPESVLTFHLAQPAPVVTVSQQEMARLSYAAGPTQPQRVAGPPRRYYSPYGYYYAPAPPYYYRPY